MTSDPFINPFRGIGRNDPCPCGSGRKFKTCCLSKSATEPHNLAGPTEFANVFSADSAYGEAELLTYDPFVEPDPAVWLALDEHERIGLVEDYHRRARLKAPNAKAHAIFHVIVENQIAEGDELPAKRTAERLVTEGLDRHEAIHAIGSVLAAHMNDLLKRSDVGNNSDANATYFAELKRLTAEAWRSS